ncbi:MAG: hypothetical protein P1P76_11520 [Anaerolineales bacterium]|nr:hypothetical protein [Anaerolineales bacterium]
MKRKPPLKNLFRAGHDGDPMIVLLPRILLDPIRSDLLFDRDLPPR